MEVEIAGDAANVFFSIPKTLRLQITPKMLFASRIAKRDIVCVAIEYNEDTACQLVSLNVIIHLRIIQLLFALIHQSQFEHISNSIQKSYRSRLTLSSTDR